MFAFSAYAMNDDFTPKNITFNHITIRDGLPNDRVDCMIQDYEGYIWFGTKRGLCRYNGYDFKTYTSIINDSTSLCYHQISCLLESSDSTLWIGTWTGGLHKYNRIEDSFIRIDFGRNQHLSNNILKLFEDSNKRIWVAFNEKLYLINKCGAIEEVFASDGKTSLANVSTIYEDDNGKIYIASSSFSSIIVYNRELTKSNIVAIDSPSGKLPGKINQFFLADKQNLWLASDNGLFNLSIETGEINFIHQKNSPSSGKIQHFIFAGNNDDIWIGGENGLYLYNKTEKEFEHFTHEISDPKTITGNIITCGFQDNQKNYWFGTFSQGLNVLYHKTKFFNRNYELTDKLENESKNITAIYKNEEGYLFLGTWDKGLLILDEKKQFVQTDPKFFPLKHLNNKIVRSICADKEGVIWIGSGNDMITSFDFKKNQSKIYQTPSSLNTPESQITKILIDSQDRYWVANSTGVFLFNPGTGNFKKYLDDANTQDIVEDNQGNIWCANYANGLCRINADGSVSFLKTDTENINLPDDKFTCIYRDIKRRLWIGTEFNGLFLYMPKTKSFQQLTVKDGLPSNDICSIQEDLKGRLWIGTNNGLSRFNYDLKDFSNYFQSDGMSANEFHYNSSFINESGELYFGCTNGLVFFHPDDIRGNYLTFPVILEDISINNGTVLKDLTGNSITKALRTSTPFQLKFNQNTINFKYSTLNYSLAKKSNFAYQLIGLDNEFSYVQNQRQVTYTNLKPGEYIFKVIASNNDNIWDRKGTEIAFKIKNPPWLTWWAYLIYGFIILLVLYGLRLQIRHEEKMKAAIHLERIEKKQQSELNQMKLRFFTNISHEFKTPLTLIIGPLEQVISELHGNSSLKTKLKQINANSKRLLELINQLIDFRKIEQDALPLEKSRNNLIETVQNTMTAFMPVAAKNKISFTLNTEFEELHFNYDSDKIEKILNNVLVNSYKYTNNGGTISIRISLSKENKVNIRISDTGIGIDPDRIKRIFERFNNPNSNVNNLEMQSSGIGLAYSKKLVELHGGSLLLESKANEGTAVTIELPYDTQMLSTDEKAEQDNAAFVKDEIITTSETENNIPVDRAHLPHILVVEDNRELRKYIVSILADLFHVDEAEDGKIGCEMAIKGDYDLIVSDIMMPNMNGTHLCKKIKSNFKTSHIHVILLTAKSDVTSKMEGYETGADSYLTKPFLPQHLIQVIKNLLNTRKHIKEFYTSYQENQQEPVGIHPRDKQFIKSAIDVIEKNIDNEGFSVEILGNELGLSRTHLFRKFKSLTGTAPNDFIRQIRLKKAAQLIKEGEFTISEIAYMVGFNIPANFSTSFKNHYGISPKEFMKRKQLHT